MCVCEGGGKCMKNYAILHAQIYETLYKITGYGAIEKNQINNCLNNTKEYKKETLINNMTTYLQLQEKTKVLTTDFLCK